MQASTDVRNAAPPQWAIAPRGSFSGLRAGARRALRPFCLAGPFPASDAVMMRAHSDRPHCHKRRPRA
jgi:hypothetical protein